MTTTHQGHYSSISAGPSTAPTLDEARQHYKGSNAERLVRLFRDTRSRTQDLVSTLEPDDMVVQTAHYTSPAKWHIGHVSWIYEAIMGKVDKRYGFEEGEISEYLNSYYQQFGTPHDKASRGIVSRPTTEKMFKYFEETSGKVERFISDHKDDIDAYGSDGGGMKVDSTLRDTARLLEMGMHHECQHQELMIYDLQHMLADRYRPVHGPRSPPATVRNGDKECKAYAHSKEQGVQIDGGLYMLGYSGDGYCYDIELPEHKTYLNPYCIDAYPVTNEQYMEFIADGGYRTYKYWLSDGWESVKEKGWEAPMYWEMGTGGNSDDDASWYTRDFAGRRKINPGEPVCHVSYYEADAYCRWAKKRLPTEAEWEKAACWNENMQQKTQYPWGNDAPTPERCNLLESWYWRCAEIGAYPKGASAYGCHQMIGDVWEWTASEFTGYPGFRSGFDEYNDKWFANQKVLRGGSFGTPGASVRASYRNFFRPDERWMISGFRCAQDI